MDWHAHFETLGDHLDARCPDGERYAAWLQAEDTDFIRFNRGLVRQPGTVHNGAVSLRWLRSRRHASAQVTLTGNAAEDMRRLETTVDDLRARLDALPEDPHLLLPEAPRSTRRLDDAPLPDARRATACVVDAAARHGLDLVGVYAGGALHRGYRDAAGQRNAFTRHGFVFDWCLVHDADKAVKRSWAGGAWSDEGFARQLDGARADLAVLGRPSKRLAPGHWRAFLSPAALLELVDLLSLDAFSVRAQRQRRSPLQGLVEGERTLDPRVHLSESPAAGQAPGFGPNGFVQPDRLTLVSAGRHAGALVSPRSAAEYGIDTTGADEDESASAVEMAGGDLPASQARAALGEGLWVANLWYANHSDRNTARMTGMTRFATLWVEDGEPVAPVEVMRFDDTIYGLLGDRLEAITAETAFLPSTSSYGWRSVQSTRLPGVLVEGLRLVS